MKVIVYSQDNGVVAVVRPTAEALEHMTIQQIAEKDVPTGKPFAIVDASDIPTDRSERMGWRVDNADLKDGVGA